MKPVTQTNLHVLVVAELGKDSFSVLDEYLLDHFLHSFLLPILCEETEGYQKIIRILVIVCILSLLRKNFNLLERDIHVGLLEQVCYQYVEPHQIIKLSF